MVDSLGTSYDTISVTIKIDDSTIECFKKIQNKIAFTFYNNLSLENLQTEANLKINYK